MVKIIKNKKGWIKVLEAFISIVLLLGLLFVILSTQERKKGDEIHMIKIEKIIEEIRIDETLRNEVIAQSNLPIHSNQSGFSQTLKNFIGSKDYNGCSMGICKSTDSCDLLENVKGEVFTKESFFVGNDELFSPRKLKIFCIIE